ncbi:hypothetical protein AX769_21770 (plasmid) [Frondihabitans sp. PAMC 28766]|uniref:hypothetical protein n=1 Tax=Frondihabitans sp. PAMC 28766 TaxID=1795630 RepID=UPI00078CFD49|nr:hypothetical protein [Frondihabitans sp. PAMC 28766]AMM22771.1 hypothetical protein AX769_21770 [Frondihabitans sp. PAMC 28766]
MPEDDPLDQTRDPTLEPLHIGPRRFHALADDRRARLGAQAVGTGAFLGGVTGFYGVRYVLPHPVVLAAAVAMASSAAILIAGVTSWHRHPEGTHVRIELDQWAHAGILPATVILGTALPRIAARIDRNGRDLWRACFLFAIYTDEILLQMIDHPVNVLTIAFFAIAVTYGVGAVGWTIYYRVRWVPVLRQLLTEGQRRFTTPPAKQE